jgi:hypothetical protein
VISINLLAECLHRGSGGDPADEKVATRKGMTVTEVCDWYLSEAESVRLLGRRNRPIKVSTLAMDRSQIETHIKPLLTTLGKTIRDTERNGEHPVALAAVRFLCLTGFRISEGQDLQRAWLHADRG